MANIGNKIPATHSGSIAGLFKDESKAEKAIEDLRSNGFSEREIGIATAHQEGTIGRFWDNLTNKFGQQEHTEHASDLHESLRDSGVPDQQARYFNSVLGSGGVLITVHTDAARAPQAVATMPEFLAFNDDDEKKFFLAQGVLITTASELTRFPKKAQRVEKGIKLVKTA